MTDNLRGCRGVLFGFVISLVLWSVGIGAFVWWRGRPAPPVPPPAERWYLAGEWHIDSLAPGEAVRVRPEAVKGPGPDMPVCYADSWASGTPMTEEEFGKENAYNCYMNGRAWYSRQPGSSTLTVELPKPGSTYVFGMYFPEAVSTSAVLEP